MSGIFHRVSIRQYEDRPIEPEKVEKMLRAAMAAPSACNQQPWEFYVVENKEIIKKLSESTPYTVAASGAPVVFVPVYRAEGIVPQYFHIDMSAAVENLLLEADELGLGAVWMGIAPEEDRMETVKNILSLPDDLIAFAIIPCGYPAESRPQEDRYDAARVHIVK